MKSFKRFLSEESSQGLSEFGKWFNMSGFQLFGNLGSSNNFFTNYFGLVLGGAGAKALGPPFVTQTMLDAFDFNGDGLVGRNDIAYGQILASTIFQYGLDNGTENVPPFMNAAEWRENWESINEQYGLDLPNPDGFFGVPGSPGLEIPDTLGNDVTTIANFFPLIRAVAGLAGDQNTYFPILYPDLYNELYQKYDLNGDGDITVLTSQFGNEYDSDEYLAYFMFVVLDERGVDLNQSIPETLLGVDGFANFIQTYFYTRGESGGLTNLIMQRIIDAGYVIPELPAPPPPPPEEIPQSQAPPPEIGMA
tara:strand:- start:104 stop:1024 length:921 start_codon:yes stop_codon:yes gene_type:complete